jgi:hydrogenase/urease accessory protein HupE
LAHVSGGGIVDSYSGLLHPFTEPLHIITIVGLGLMLSQQGRAVPPQGWISYTIAALLGLIASNAGLTLPVYMMLYPLAAILGLLVAIKPVLPRLICLLLSIIAGFTLGIDSMTGAEGIGKLIVTVFSTTTGLGIALLIVIGWGDYFTRDWQKIGIRVIGSWIATSALLVFTLNLNTN